MSQQGFSIEKSVEECEQTLKWFLISSHAEENGRINLLRLFWAETFWREKFNNVSSALSPAGLPDETLSYQQFQFGYILDALGM
jgi:hypothetical protein